MPSISRLTPSRRRMSSRRSTVISYTSSSPSASSMPLSGSGSITSSPSSTSTASCSTASGGPPIVSSAGDPIATVARPIPPIEISSTSLNGIGSPGLGGPVEPRHGDADADVVSAVPRIINAPTVTVAVRIAHPFSFASVRQRRTALEPTGRTQRGRAGRDDRRPAGACTHPTRRCCPPPRNRAGVSRYRSARPDPHRSACRSWIGIPATPAHPSRWPRTTRSRRCSQPIAGEVNRRGARCLP